MPRPFQWSKGDDDDDDDVYGVQNYKTLLGDEGAERPKTFDLHCTNVEY